MGLRNVVKRSIPLTCLYYVVQDWWAGQRLARGDISTYSGRRHVDLDIETSLAYVEMVYADYLSYAGIERFSGVLGEIGPGDNFGIALLALAGGASEVHAIDRFYSHRDPEQQRRIYQALSKRHNLAHLFDGEPAEETIRGLGYHPGQLAETFFRSSGIAFDAIISRAVIEHLYDPIGALNDMVAALNPGGLLIHRIDLRDHGMFARHHPLTFLTIPGSVYRRMTPNTGRPNRILFPAYRDWLDRADGDGSLRITRLAGVDGEVGPAIWNDLDVDLRQKAEETLARIRPRLAAPFREMSDQDLAVSGCLMVARKRAMSADDQRSRACRSAKQP